MRYAPKGDAMDHIAGVRCTICGRVMPYQEQMIEFCPGDSLYLYTDGVTEAFNTDEELYTEARMLEALNRHREAREQPGLMLDCMYRELEEFSRGAEQSDDITMMYLVR